MNLSGRVARVDHTRIICGRSWRLLEQFLRNGNFLRRKIFILTDENTGKHCLPLLYSGLPFLRHAVVLEIPGGEEHKTLQQAEILWTRLSQEHADRGSLLINLGGGVVTDLGGFVAAGYMRGMPCVHLPTTLIAQVDAAIGGKTAVNLQGVKNQIGFFYAPLAIFVFPCFLSSLNSRHLISGLAEILKTALVGDPVMLRRIMRQPIEQWSHCPPEDKSWIQLIQNTIMVKNRVVRHDFLEKKQRRILNFGHTFGHAFEALAHRAFEKPLLHGETVAMGMICSLFLSHLKTGFPEAEKDGTIAYIRSGFSFDLFRDQDFSTLLEFMKHDKKNQDGLFRLTLLKQPGKAVVNVPCNEEEIHSAYQDFLHA